MTPFQTPHAKLLGFSDAYAADISARAQTIETLSKIALAALCIGFLVALWLFARMHIGIRSLSDLAATGELYNLIFYSAVFLSVAYGALGYFFHYIRQRYKALIFPLFRDFLGWSYETAAGSAVDLEPFRAFKLLPSKFNQVSRASQLSGAIGGVHFLANDLVLKQRSSDNKSSVAFRGTVVVFTFQHTFKATTMVLQDRGVLNPRRLRSKGHTAFRPTEPLTRERYRAIVAGDWQAEEFIGEAVAQQRLDRVDLVTQGFERKFEAFSTDQVEARVLMTPDFIEQLILLEKSVQGRALRFGFYQNKLFIVFNEPSIYDPRTLFSRLTHRLFAQSVLDEVSALISIANLVVKKRNSFDQRNAQPAPRPLKAKIAARVAKAQHGAP